ncbi:MAG: hypothetical protein JJE21_05995 [Spirochaetaceae bacterium]|nr:hypothetical protein [Spirochaetaceae bacterium]
MNEQIGPIHNWVFNKIKFQETEVEELLKLSVGLNIDVVAGTIEKGELQDIVNTPNIHTFLQERIYITEKRLALSVETLLEKGITLEVIKETLFNFGLSNSFDSSVSAQKAYELLGKLMVSGMPCDRIESVKGITDTKIIYKENKDIHSEYWNDKALYQVLKDEVIKGLLYKTTLSYSHLTEREFVIEEK